MNRAPVLLLLLAGCAGAAAPPAATPAPAPPAPSSTPPPSADRSPPDAKASLSGASASGARTYSRADLEALERQQSWSELVDHLEDLPPSERDDRWKALVTRSVVGYLASNKNATGPHKEMLRAKEVEAIAQRYPSLRTAPAFIDARGDILVAAITGCINANYWPPCDWIGPALEGDPKHALAGGKAGHLNTVFAMALFRSALAGDAKAVCSDDDALGVMLHGLSTPHDGQYYKDAVAMQDRCRELKKK